MKHHDTNKLGRKGLHCHITVCHRRMSGQGRNLEAGAEAEECCLLAFRGLVHYHHGRGRGGLHSIHDAGAVAESREEEERRRKRRRKKKAAAERQRETDTHTGKERDRQTEKQKDRETETKRQKDRETDRNRDRDRDTGPRLGFYNLKA